ncbi:hypothetical protein PDE_07818 [Penicillium oxalicum 114-2]|uniref:Uncharacterized protein n=1 Tax=Penicillium oxalicum (strain 114-2 / CGMCC 5302) TaxID=933388 RepID=S8BD37_PENO1|nr:hypothetical protein PDE_07818 [Penicillium oxalicum 114-2]
MRTSPQYNISSRVLLATDLRAADTCSVAGVIRKATQRDWLSRDCFDRETSNDAVLIANPSILCHVEISWNRSTWRASRLSIHSLFIVSSLRKNQLGCCWLTPGHVERFWCIGHGNKRC